MPAEHGHNILDRHSSRNKYLWDYVGKDSFLWILFVNALLLAMVDVMRNVLVGRKEIYAQKEGEAAEQLIEMREK